MREIVQSILLERLEDLAEKQFQTVIQDIQNLPSAVLVQRPPLGGWSIAECLEHLNSYSAFYLPRLSTALEKASQVSGDTTFRHTLLGSCFIRLMDPSTSKKKMKAMKKHQPTRDLDPHTVVAVWIQHMESLLKLLKKARMYDLKRIRVATSISPLIRLNGGDAIHFVLVHSSRHLAQAMLVVNR